jgi:hypothetical protein
MGLLVWWMRCGGARPDAHGQVEPYGASICGRWRKRHEPRREGERGMRAAVVLMITALVTAMGGRVLEPGVYQLRVGTPLTVAAIAHRIGWVTMLEVPEP